MLTWLKLMNIGSRTPEHRKLNLNLITLLPFLPQRGSLYNLGPT